MVNKTPTMDHYPEMDRWEIPMGLPQRVTSKKPFRSIFHSAGSHSEAFWGAF